VPAVSVFFYFLRLRFSVFRRYCIQVGACPLGAKSKTINQKRYATTSMSTTHGKNVDQE
jgi:hypothetical protein